MNKKFSMIEKKMQIYSRCKTWIDKIIKMARDWFKTRKKPISSLSVPHLSQCSACGAYHEELHHQNRNQSVQSVYHNYSNQIYVLQLNWQQRWWNQVRCIPCRGMIGDDIALETKIYALKMWTTFLSHACAVYILRIEHLLASLSHVWHDSSSHLITCTDLA